MGMFFKYTRKILSILFDVILAVLLVFAVYVISCSSRGKVASVGGCSVLKVVTGSMEPSIYTGDYIIVKKADTDTLKKGDIISFYSEDMSIYGLPNTHRIIDISEDGCFITMGDASGVRDSIPVKPERVIGKYAGKARFFKWISSLASGRKLIFIAAILPLIAVSVFELINVSKIGAEISNEKQKEIKEKLIREAVEEEKRRLYEEAGEKNSMSGEEGGDDS